MSTALRRLRRRLRRRGIGLLHVYVGLLLLFLFLPLAVLVLFSFSASGQLRFPITGLALRWYQEVFSNSGVIDGILASLGVAAVTGAVVAPVRTLAAVAVNRYRFRGSALVAGVILAPAALPGLGIGIALPDFFRDLHVPLSLLTVSIGHGI